MRRLFSFVAVALFALGPIACAATTDESDPTIDSASGEDEEIKAAKPITDADDGKTIQVATGQSFSIQLASNPTTGYKWAIQSVDKTLGYPKESYKSASAAVGSGGTQRFTWSTKSPLDLDGKHKITLAYARSWETKAPLKTFTVTVEIGATAKCGDGPACGTGKWCSMCWGHMACIPKGAMC
jgi:inhibitor of cysteine peptidase